MSSLELVITTNTVIPEMLYEHKVFKIIQLLGFTSYNPLWVRSDMIEC